MELVMGWFGVWYLRVSVRRAYLEAEVGERSHGLRVASVQLTKRGLLHSIERF